ncbi:hypothetical protein EDB92DRAFT_1801483, partial [Lactarius akahatsu]
STHACRLDDPLTWGILPACMYLQFHMTRWILGVSDIMFTNPYGRPFPFLGQVLEAFSGTGIYQPAIDTAIEKLRGCVRPKHLPSHRHP